MPDPGANAPPIEFGILTGPADVRLVNFLPFADETTERVAKTSFERAVGGVELLTSEHVNALVVEGMDRFTSFEVKVVTRLGPAAPAVLMNCGDRSQVIFPPGGPVPPQDSPVHCAFALLGPNEPKTIELELVGKLKAFRNPKLPSLESNFDWNPLEPRPADLKAVTAGNVTRLFGGAKTAVRGGDWRAAVGTAQACINALPTSAECHLLYGYACSNLSDRACAEKHYRAFLRLAPAHSVAAEVQAVLAESPPPRAKR